MSGPSPRCDLIGNVYLRSESRDKGQRSRGAPAPLTLYLRSSKFPPNPLMPEIKWRRPGENQYRCVLRFIVLFYSRIGFIKDFLRYDNDSGGFLVALVIRRCVNATEATMETARSVEEGWREVKASVGC